jgi:hypothetical protein
MLTAVNEPTGREAAQTALRQPHKEEEEIFAET